MKKGVANRFFLLMSCIMLCVFLADVPVAVYGQDGEEKKTSDFNVSGKIWIAVDSIAADHSDENEADYVNFVHGWGEMLGNYMTKDVQVMNRAISGQTAKWFVEEDNYREIMDGIGEGDLLLIQFGHNDYKSAGGDHYSLPTDTEGSYRWYLKNYYIDPALEAGAMPVLCTSVVLCQFIDNTVKENQPQKLFADSMRILYEEYKAKGIEIGFIDTYSITQMFLNANSSNADSYYALKYDRYYDYDGRRTTSLDRVHFSEEGASAVADMISQNLFLMYKDMNRFNPRDMVEGGDGTEESPYLISTWAQLYQILWDDERNAPDKYYKLINGLQPIVSELEWETVFRANLDGGGYLIKNITGKSQRALFDRNYGSLSNFRLFYRTQHTPRGLQYFFIKDNYGTIRDCNASGSMEINCFEQDSDFWSCGVFAGENHDGALIENCKNQASFVLNSDIARVYAGGVCGKSSGVIKNCSNSGKIRVDLGEAKYYRVPPVYDNVVSCAGGIAGVVLDDYIIEDCTAEKLPICSNFLKSDAVVLLSGLYRGATEASLSEAIEESLNNREPEIEKGDINNDRIINLTDANLALRFALSIEKPNEIQFKTADTDDDGMITLKDANRILRAALGIEKLRKL